MGFKEITDLSADTTISLGGVNKKTGKANPKSIEGYYLGAKQVEDKKKKDGKAYIYIFQTAKGNVGVWGKTDLDRKMLQATPGTMVRATHTGMQATPNGEMYKYKVEADADNTIEVTTESQSYSSSSEEESDYVPTTLVDESELDQEDAEQEAQLQALAAQAAARKAKVEALLKAKKN